MIALYDRIVQLSEFKGGMTVMIFLIKIVCILLMVCLQFASSGCDSRGSIIKPIIFKFAAKPFTIISGGSSTLSWSVSGAASRSIDKGIGAVTGTSCSVSPDATTTYTLTAANAMGSSTASATVTVENIAAPDVWVMGYYVGYHSLQQPPASVDYRTMTHIMVGSALPQTNGTFDTQFYIGPTDGPAWARESVRLAHLAGIKAILMAGGAGDDTITAFRRSGNAVTRAAFVTNLKAIVDDYGFDGVDIDWEPIQMGPFPLPDDRSSLQAFSQDLRTAMPDKIMTIPVGWNNANINEMTDTYYGTISQYYDRVNMMSYGMNWCGNGWYSWHSSPLYGETTNTPSSINNTVQSLLAAGVPRGKIGIGMGFYGQAYENGTWQSGTFVHATSGPYVTMPYQVTDNAAIRFSDNDVSYSNIIRYYYEPAALSWDDTAKATYLSFSAPKEVPVPDWADPPVRTTYLPYEDERSIAAKGTYVKDEGLGGIIIWTISEGYLDWKTSGEQDPLMKAAKAAFLP
ncbi:MAG: glycoside hydrolase family 18 protein [Pseudomonadota bacterium]